MEINFNPMRLNDIRPLEFKVVNKEYIPLVSGGYNLLTGTGGTGKSLIALKSAVVYLIDNPEHKALLWFSEDGKQVVEKRLRFICNAMPEVSFEEMEKRMKFITLETDDRIKMITRGRNDIEVNSEYLDKLIRYSILEDIGFIVLDPLKRFHRLDENSNSEMPFLTKDIFEFIAVRTESVLLVLHHSAKGEHGARGAGAIADDARMGWVIGRVTKKDRFTNQVVDIPGYESRVSLAAIKDNYGIARSVSILDSEGTMPLPVPSKVTEIVYED